MVTFLIISKGQDELEKELRSLPVRQCDTLKYKQRKMDIEVKLNELDEAVKVKSLFFEQS